MRKLSECHEGMCGQERGPMTLDGKCELVTKACYEHVFSSLVYNKLLFTNSFNPWFFFNITKTDITSVYLNLYSNFSSPCDARSFRGPKPKIT